GSAAARRRLTRGPAALAAPLLAQPEEHVGHACFAHPMIRSAVYAELSAGERPRAHTAVARLLHEEGAPSDRVAQHLLAGVPTDEPWALEALHEGARTAARRGAPEVAVRYLRHAVERFPRDERLASLLVDLGLVEAAAGETTSLARFDQALSMIDEPAEQARAL